MGLIPLRWVVLGVALFSSTESTLVKKLSSINGSIWDRKWECPFYTPCDGPNTKGCVDKWCNFDKVSGCPVCTCDTGFIVNKYQPWKCNIRARRIATGYEKIKDANYERCTEELHIESGRSDLVFGMPVRRKDCYILCRSREGCAGFVSTKSERILGEEWASHNETACLLLKDECFGVNVDGDDGFDDYSMYVLKWKDE